MHPEVLDKKRAKLFPKLRAFKDFYLAGGTALALQLGHRISLDFDLFSHRRISESLLGRVQETFSPLQIAVAANSSEELTVAINQVKISFIFYPFPRLLPLKSYRGVRLLDLREIAVTKAYTIGRRGSYRDYVDLYFLLADGYISLKKIIDLAERKYETQFNSRLFLEQLLYLEDVTDTAVIFLKKKVTKGRLVKFFESQIGRLKVLPEQSLPTGLFLR